MQVTAGKKRFDLGQFKMAALIIGIAGSLAIGAVTVAIIRDESTDTSLETSAVTAPKAVHVEQAGEGLLGDTGHLAVLPDTVDARAYYVPGAGEGIIGGYGRESIEPLRPLTLDGVRYYEHKEARQEAVELQAAALAARAAQQQQMQRFYEHKEARQEAEELHRSVLAARAAAHEEQPVPAVSRLQEPNVLPGDDIQLILPSADPEIPLY